MTFLNRKWGKILYCFLSEGTFCVSVSQEDKMILVVGSTGMLGSEICRLLGERGLAFRAMARETSDPAKVERGGGEGTKSL